MTNTPQPIGCPVNEGTIEVTYVETTLLRAHPLNKKLYGDEPDETFADDLVENGLLEPLIVTTSSLIISGHRRWHAAQRLGLTTVPARIISEEDPDSLERLLLSANSQRKKTREQQIREFEHYLSLESKAAKKRQGRRSDIGETFPESERGRARKSAAEKVGLSDRSAQRGLQILHALGERDSTENAQLLEEVRTVFNENGVEPAFKRAVALGWIPKPARRITPTTATSQNETHPQSGVQQPSNLPHRDSAVVTPESVESHTTEVIAEARLTGSAPSAATVGIPDIPVQEEATAPAPILGERFTLADRSTVELPTGDVVSLAQLRTGFSRLMQYAKEENDGTVAVSAGKLTTIQRLYLALAETLNLQFPNGLEEDERSLVLGALQALAHTIENSQRK